MRFSTVLSCLALAVLASASNQPDTLRAGILRVSDKCRAKVSKNAELTLHYTARVWGEDETYDNTYTKERPMTYKLGRDSLPPSMEKGIEGMCEGEIRRVLVPADMAYGELGMPDIVPPNTAIIYDIELIKVNSPFTNPWFYAGLVTIALGYVFVSRMSNAADSAKAAKFLASRSDEAQPAQESKKDQ